MFYSPFHDRDGQAREESDHRSLGSHGEGQVSGPGLPPEHNLSYKPPCLQSLWVLSTPLPISYDQQ